MNSHRPGIAMLITALCLNVAALQSAEDSRAGKAPSMRRAANLSTAEARIVNGLTTTLFPSVVSIIDPVFGATSCTGTFVGCETVLTAAHCVCSSTGGNCQSGGSDLANPADLLIFAQHGGFYGVSDITVHPAFEFTVGGDIALLKLSAKVEGIAPSQINVRSNPTAGSTGLLTGFGLTGDGESDTGVKRYGEIMTAPCVSVPGSPHVCWDFLSPLGPPGDDSNTCNGDSGGPLFLADWSQLVVGGVTSGGGPTCAPNSTSFDTNTHFYRNWIQTEAGSDTTNIACGPLSQAGTPTADIFFGEGMLTAQNTTEYWTVEVPTGTEAVIFTLNGDDTFPNDVDLFVKFGDFPTTADFDCSSAFSGNPEFCRINAPTAGTWYVMVDRFDGSVFYQTTVTVVEGELLFAEGHESGELKGW